MLPHRPIRPHARPLPGQLNRVHPLPARHPPPINATIRFNHFEPRQFFGPIVPFDEQTIRRFARMEGTWDCSLIHPLDRGCLRLFVWKGECATPELHWEEVVKRWPEIEQTVGTRTMFLEMARAQNEPRHTSNTGRCPLCASMFWGFCLADHTHQQCPFQSFRGIDRLHFQALNLISLCRECSSRSVNHYTKDCKPKVCQTCKKFGHQTHQDLCDHPLGANTVEAAASQKAEVLRYRLLYLERVNGLLMDPNHPLRYRCYNDSRLFKVIDSIKLRNKKFGEEAKGWGVVMDPEYNFVSKTDPHYANHYDGLPVEFTGMVPPEYIPEQSLPVAEFDPRFVAYLVQVGRSIDHLRATEQYVPPMMPEGFLEYLEELEDRNRPGRVSPQPLQLNQEQPAQPEREQAPPSQPSTSQDSNSSELVGGPDWKEKPLDWAKEMQDKTKSSAATENAATSSSQVDLQENAETGTTSIDSTQREQQSQESVQQSSLLPTTPTKEKKENLPEEKLDTEKLEKEEDVVRRTRMLCREPLVVETKIIRQQFQSKAFSILEEEPLPESLRLLKWRARTLQEVLCGRMDSRIGIFDNFDLTTISDYIELLMKLGRRIRSIHYLLVTLEEKDSFLVTGRAFAGGDIVYVPSIDLCQRRAIQVAIERLLEIQPSPIEWFITDKRVMWPINRAAMEQANPLIGTEEESREEATLQLQLQDLRTCTYDQVSGVLLHDRGVLQKLVERSIPLHVVPKRQRIIGLSTFLTGKLCEDRNRLEDSTLDDYIELLLNVCHLVVEIRDSDRSAKIEFSGCADHIMSSATRFHSLVLPNIMEFSNHPYQKWKAYMESVWKSFRDQCRQATCTVIQGI